MTQQELATALRLEHRQSLAAIEVGERQLSAEELLLAMQTLKKELDYFTDTFRLVGEGEFSFRARPDVSARVYEEFEERAGRWIATYRTLGAHASEASPWLVHKLALTKRSSFEEAASAGESVAAAWQLGTVPAKTLRDAMERELDALVLCVDAPLGISGAALQLPRLPAVLINRNEPAGRRTFGLAHELFHLLTWDAMPPERVEPVDVHPAGKGTRVEQLAENFAGGLLMPSDLLWPRWQERDPSGDVHQWLVSTATALGVSGTALKWRIHNLGWLGKAAVRAIDDQRLTMSSADDRPGAAERLFSERFVSRIASALEAGQLSVQRVAGLLGITREELASLLLEYGHEPGFDP